MTSFLLAGGGTAGHVNPLLAIADRLRETHSDASIAVLGTPTGLETRLVPQRGYELLTIPKLPFPRRPNAAALRFPVEWARSVRTVRGYLRDRSVDIVVGVGGYAAAPAYIAARRERLPFVIHEANAMPGLANRLGARFTEFVGVAFPETPLPHARFVGLPLRREIEELDIEAARPVARAFFGLDERPTLLVTGGSTGARRINRTVLARAGQIVEAGYQVIHLQGGAHEFEDPGVPGYHLIDYCDRMDLAFSVTALAVSRAGGTLAELTALGIPAVYVPYAVGNGEQRINARGVVDAGGGLLVDDEAFTPDEFDRTVLPLLHDRLRLAEMARAAASVGLRNGSALTVGLIDDALRDRGARRGGGTPRA